MTEKIIQILNRLHIDTYMIGETKTESVECFFIRRKMDLKRRTDLTEYTVTVYCPFEKEGEKMLGSSSVQISPEMEEAEMEERLSSACRAASFVCNPYYELYAGEKREFVPSAGSLAGHTLEENVKAMAEALFAADTSETVFVNSAELFARRILRRVVNSAGVDVSYETCDVNGEYVIQCLQPQDVETYHHFSYRDMETEALRRDVEEALSMTQARAQATAAPKAGEYRIILSGEQVATLLEYYLDRAGSAMIYQEYSNYRTGMPVQGENVTGDPLTILLKARDPYSEEGIPMIDRVLLENGTLRTIHGGNRFGYYLGIEPTGNYRYISVPVGQKPLKEMKSGAYLHIVSFSDFQMDSYSGHFGGEIRLAFLCDGDSVTPVTGGSVNGSILEVQDRLVFSKERYRNGSYEGPLAVSIEGVKVAGA